MRKVIYGGACSLDGYLTDRDGKLDWLHFSRDAEKIMARSWANTDTLLLGRKTWEATAAQGGGGGAMPGVKTYIFSRTLTVAPKHAELVTADAGAFVRALKLQPGKDL